MSNPDEPTAAQFLETAKKLRVVLDYGLAGVLLGDNDVARCVLACEIAAAPARMLDMSYVERLRAALKAVIDDIHEYERINRLAPNPPRMECWDSVAHALRILADTADSKVCAETADFLDAMAIWLGELNAAPAKNAADECRTMARKLRGNSSNRPDRPDILS